MPEKSAEYTCKILPYGNIASVIIAMYVSMTILFLGIYAGVPAFINVILLLAIMFFIFSILSANATFYISESTLTKTLNTSSFIFLNIKNKQYSWNDVKAFKNGTDKGKYRGEFQYLEIKFKKGDEWRITDMYGEKKESYTILLNLFLEQVNQINDNRAVAGLELQHTINPPLIKRNKTIYETIWGRIFTILLGIFIGVLLIYGKPYMSGSSMYKMTFVLIPGFAYMVYRTFISKYR